MQDWYAPFEISVSEGATFHYIQTHLRNMKVEIGVIA
jgi:hypothetical protein